MQDLYYQSTAQSLSQSMQGRQNPSALFVNIEDAYFRAAQAEAQDQGLGVDVFVQQRLFGWCSMMRIAMQYSAPWLIPNSGGPQFLQQSPASNPNENRAYDSSRQSSSSAKNFRWCVNVGGNSNIQNRSGLQANQSNPPSPHQYYLGVGDPLDPLQRQDSPNLEPNSRAIVYQIEEESQKDQVHRLSLSRESYAEENPQPLNTSSRPYKHLDDYRRGQSQASPQNQPKPQIRFEYRTPK